MLDPQHIQPSVSTLAAIDDKLPVSSSNLLNPSIPSSLPLNPFDPSVAGGAFNNPQINGMPMSMGMGINPGGGHGTPSGQGHGQFNLMQQQMMMMLQMQQAMMMGQMGMGMGAGMGGVNASPMAGGAAGGGVGGGAMSTPTRGGGIGGGQLAGRMGGFAHSPANLAPLPPPPPGGEDPRARRGRVSYQDLDEPGAGGGGGLPY